MQTGTTTSYALTLAPLPAGPCSIGTCFDENDHRSSRFSTAVGTASLEWRFSCVPDSIHLDSSSEGLDSSESDSFGPNECDEARYLRPFLNLAQVISNLEIEIETGT
jgi:hypothetical protein